MLNNHNPVGWFEIYVQDMPRAKAFYESVFQQKLERLNTPPEVELWSFPMAKDRPGVSGALVKMEGVFLPVGAVRLSISSVQTARLRWNAPRRLVDVCTARKCRLASMDLLPWLSTPKVIYSACIRCNDWLMLLE